MPTLPQVPDSLFTGAAVVCGALVGLLVFSLAVWTARDSAARTRRPLLRLGAMALVLFVPVFGLAAYLLLRPRETVAERYERELVEEILAREMAGVGRRDAAATPGPAGTE